MPEQARSNFLALLWRERIEVRVVRSDFALTPHIRERGLMTETASTWSLCRIPEEGRMLSKEENELLTRVGPERQREKR
jgi:hypothetical protein